MSGGLLGRPPEDFFMELGEFSAHRHRGLGWQISQRLTEPVWGLEEHEGGRLGGDTLQQTLAMTPLAWREAGKDDRICWQPRGNERSGKGRRSREGLYLDAGFDAGAH